MRTYFLVTLSVLVSTAAHAGKKQNNYFTTSDRSIESQEQIAAKTHTPDLTANLIEGYLTSENALESTSDSTRAARARTRLSTGAISLSTIQAEYNRLRALELKVAGFHHDLETDGYSNKDFYNGFITPVTQGQPNQVSDAMDYLEKWDARNSHFIRARIELATEKQIYFMSMLKHAIQNELDRTTKKSPQIAKLAKRMEEVYKNWDAVNYELGEDSHPSNQNARMYAINEYFEKSRQLMILLGKADPLPNWQNPNTWERIEGKVGKIAYGLKILGQLIRRNFLSTNGGKPGHNSTPFTGEGGLTSLFNQMAKAEGYSLRVEGAENLQQVALNIAEDSTEKYVNLFVPAHRHTTVDAMAMTHIGLPHFLMFANAKQAVPAGFGNMAASLPEFLSVGKVKGYHPIETPEKMVQSANAGYSPNAINYPQGLVSNTGEILSINPAFTEKLLNRLMNEGFRVNLIPIAYETDSKALSYSGEVDDHNVTIKILPVILHNALKVLVDKEMASGQSKKYINHVLNSCWFDAIQKHPELTLDELMDRGERNLGVKFPTQ